MPKQKKIGMYFALRKWNAVKFWVKNIKCEHF
jgi:hypothetical protein